MDTISSYYCDLFAIDIYLKTIKTMKNNLISIGGRTKVSPQNVIALVASVNYSLAYMQDGSIIIVATPLKSLEERFKANSFFRTHKSFLINLSYVADYDHEKHLFVEMQNKLKATISRRKRKDFLKNLQNFI
jgi:DNA-binding LytR/AlgR family response regulator